MADQQRGDYPPTDQAEEFRKVVTEEMNKELKDLEKLYEDRLDQLNKAIQEQGIKLLDKKIEPANQ